ncbi:hypothetical protein F5B20DRAFT_548581 [Whalleya microplaca]|nr:hypothetical protein F5B20DRAFT_548581 [Whalleya microplaca]
MAPKLGGPVVEGFKNKPWETKGKGLESWLHHESVRIHDPVDPVHDTKLAIKVWDWTQKEMKGGNIWED